MRRSVILAALGGSPSPGPNDGSTDTSTPLKAKSSVYSRPSPLADISRNANAAGFGPLLGRKPFKPPSFANQREKDNPDGGRKRKKVDYRGMDSALQTMAKQVQDRTLMMMALPRAQKPGARRRAKLP